MDEGIVNSVDILSENGYYVAYVNGAVYCIADTYGEAVRELTNDGIIWREKIVRTENWCGYDIRFIEINGEWYAILKDVCDALKLRAKDVSQRINPSWYNWKWYLSSKMWKFTYR